NGSADSHDNCSAIVLAVCGFGSGVVEVIGFHCRSHTRCCGRPLTIAQLEGLSGGSRYFGRMRVATWNVNSIRSRVGRVVDWVVREDVDVLAMQEIKCKPDQFPYEPFAEAGYEIELHGLNQWNGVAFASRLPMTDVTIGFPGAPGFGKVDDAGDLPQEARALGVTVEDVRL